MPYGWSGNLKFPWCGKALQGTSLESAVCAFCVEAGCALRLRERFDPLLLWEGPRTGVCKPDGIAGEYARPPRFGEYDETDRSTVNSCVACNNLTSRARRSIGRG